MPFFFIAPLWLLCVAAGAILIFAGRRRIGAYVVSVSTGATVVSLVLSTAVLFLFPRLPFRLPPQWNAISLISAYLMAILLGGVAGAAGAFWLTAKIWRQQRNAANSENR